MARLLFALTTPTSDVVAASPGGRVVATCDGTLAGDKVVSATGTVVSGGAGANVLPAFAALVPLDNTVIFLGDVTVGGASLPGQPIIVMVERKD